MAINIIDGFFLGNEVPIDSRFVVDNAADRVAIVHKYDGLRVFQKDTRVTWIWNATIPDWEQEISGSISGSGTTNFLAKWTNSNTLTSSILFESGTSIGLNTIDPKSSLQINNTGISNPLSLNLRKDGSVDIASISYNYYHLGIDQYFDSSKVSSRMEMTSDTSFMFKTKRPVLDVIWQKIFILNDTSGYNFLTSLNKGTFISGSVSFGLSSWSSLYSAPQLVFVDGSFRTNSSEYESTSTIIKLFPNQYVKKLGYSYSSSNPPTSYINDTLYTLADVDSNLLCYNNNTSPTEYFRIKLPDLPSGLGQIGRIVKISNCNSDTSAAKFLYIDKAVSNNFKDNKGQTLTSFLLLPGESVELKSCIDSDGTSKIWKVFRMNNRIANTTNINGSSGDFLYYGTDWVATNFEKKTRDVLGKLNPNTTSPNTYKEFLIKFDGGTNKSYISFPQIAPSSLGNSSRSEIFLSGGLQVGDAGLRMIHLALYDPNNPNSGYSVIENNGYTTGKGSQFFIKSINGSSVADGEAIKIQTSNGDWESSDGSIQLYAKTSVEILSTTGKYYMGPGPFNSPGQLPSTNNAVNTVLTIDATGLISKTTLNYYDDISSSVLFATGISGTKNVRKYKDGTVVVSFYYSSGTIISLGVYANILTNLPSGFGTTYFRARYGQNNFQPSTMGFIDLSISGGYIKNGFNSINFGYLEFTAIYKAS